MRMKSQVKYQKFREEQYQGFAESERERERESSGYWLVTVSGR